MFAALIAVGAFIRIPVPLVPFTLQFLFTNMAGILLGSKNGAAAVLTYIVIGLSGIPVFANGGGLHYMLHPNFGYLIGFALGTFTTGKIIENQNKKISFKTLLFAGFAGLFIVYSAGISFYYFISRFYLNNTIGLWSLFLYCFVLAVPGDIALCVLSASLGKILLSIKKELML